MTLELLNWVCCSACEKWRRVPREVAQRLEEDETLQWTCSENPDARYNTCDADQEPEDLPEEEEEEEEAGEEDDISDIRMPSVWQSVEANIYRNRRRRKISDDDIMICDCCTPYDESERGCGEQCQNRMLNIECVDGHCPCGDRCSNQRFQRRQYARLDIKRAGRKGFGLFAEQDIKEGEFIIEYVGEVIAEEAFGMRRQLYRKYGQRHWYFMTIGNGEVIDACLRGNVGRYLNHSCDPNCKTEKWTVHGALAIGIFSIKDIKAGEELTFDYNFDRDGYKPTRCYCGSTNCRGVIGGSGKGKAEEHPPLELDEEEGAGELDPEPIIVKLEDELNGVLSGVGIPENDLQGLGVGAGAHVDPTPRPKAPRGRPLPSDSEKERSGSDRERERDKDKDKGRRHPRVRAVIRTAPRAKREGNEPPRRPPPRPRPLDDMLPGYKRRSEVSRTLAAITERGTGSGLKDAAAVAEFVRLFGLCDLRGEGGERRPQHERSSRAPHSRTEARMADLALLLDAIPRSYQSVREAMVIKGVLGGILMKISELSRMTDDPSSPALLIKLVDTLAALPLSAKVLRNTHTAVQSLAGAVVRLGMNKNMELSRKATQLMIKLGLTARDLEGGDRGDRGGYAGTPMNMHMGGSYPPARFTGTPGGRFAHSLPGGYGNGHAGVGEKRTRPETSGPPGPPPTKRGPGEGGGNGQAAAPLAPHPPVQPFASADPFQASLQKSLPAPTPAAASATAQRSASNGKTHANGLASRPGGSGGGGRGGGPGGLTWTEPNGQFSEWALKTIRELLGLGVAAPVRTVHPMIGTLARDEAEILSKKIHSKLVEGERSEHDKRRRAGRSEPLNEFKVRQRITDFIKRSVDHHLGAA